MLLVSKTRRQQQRGTRGIVARTSKAKKHDKNVTICHTSIHTTKRTAAPRASSRHHASSHRFIITDARPSDGETEDFGRRTRQGGRRRTDGEEIDSDARLSLTQADRQDSHRRSKDTGIKQTKVYHPHPPLHTHSRSLTHQDDHQDDLLLSHTHTLATQDQLPTPSLCIHPFSSHSRIHPPLMTETRDSEIL